MHRNPDAQPKFPGSAVTTTMLGGVIISTQAGQRIIIAVCQILRRGGGLGKVGLWKTGCVQPLA